MNAKRRTSNYIGAIAGMTTPAPATERGECSRLRREDILALYFFDIYDDHNLRVDEVGVDLASVEQACEEARQSLSDIAGDELYERGEHRSFLILVRNEQRAPVYTATLNFTGLRLGS